MEAHNNNSMEIIHEDEKLVQGGLENLTLVEKEIESLLDQINSLVEKEKQSHAKMKEQESFIREICLENTALKEENNKLQLIIQQYMQKFQCFSQETKQIVNSDRTRDIACRTEMIIEKADVMLNIKEENLELNNKNTFLTQENENLKKELETLKEDFEKLNNFISTSFENTLNNTYVKKIRELEEKLAKTDKKKNQSKKKEPDQKSVENNKRSPIETRHRKTTKKVHVETPQTEQTTVDIDIEDDEDFEVSVASFRDDEDDDYYEESPKKGKRKKSGTAAQSKKGGSNKKSMKSQNKELRAVNRNTIQYHLWN